MELIYQTKLFLVSQIHPMFIQDTVVTDDLFLSPKFFITIISGVILALAFQLILTALSVAMGITAIGNLKEKFVKASNHTGDSSDDNNNDTFDQDYSSDTSMGVKITSGFGIWSVITTCLSLFAATALAVNLSMFETGETSLTLGLVIWALFFIILFYLEVKIANTAIGGLINTATSGLKASSKAVQNMLTSSKEKKIENLVTNTIDKVKSEFDASSNLDQISSTLDNFLNKVDNKLPNYDQLKNDISEIADTSGSTNNSGKWMAIQQVLNTAVLKGSENKDSQSTDKTQKLKDLMAQLKDTYDSDASKTENAKKMLEQFTDMDRQEIDERIAKFKSTLQSAKPESFSSNQLKEDIRKIIENPKMLLSIASGKVKDIDRDSIIDILEKNTNLDRAQIDKYALQVEESVSSVTSKFNKEQIDNLTKSLEARVASFFNGTEREELNYDSLKEDMVKIIDKPSDSFTIIKDRLKKFDKNTVRSLITRNKGINDSHIDRISDTIEQAKTQVSDKLHAIEMRARQEMEMIKRKAVIKAEHTRKTAASAAWWLVITAVLSAGAAVTGGFIS
ncbi:hypothetical protein NBT05_08645 [Aquimarina sp. ERC-38]|uniref:hypothetical protein n=1 Tax=Aquimarina sp. ERC-38 TaxID=2949996 RepID=UPI002247822D|nr:hypothetical protein [Aquimarina sp. ERC-38]UZO82530.1 hypothetical protein NBT05_08645 [Aquimarina sp. ERC-38]